jgi:subtilisin family serine protease
MKILKALQFLGISFLLTCAAYSAEKFDNVGYEMARAANLKFVKMMETKFHFGVKNTKSFRGLSASTLNFREQVNFINQLSHALQFIKYPRTYPMGESIYANQDDLKYPLPSVHDGKTGQSLYLPKTLDWFKIVLLFSTNPGEEQNFSKLMNEYAVKLYNEQFHSLKEHTQTSYKTLFDQFEKFCAGQDIEEFREELIVHFTSKGFNEKEVESTSSSNLSAYTRGDLAVYIGELNEAKSSLSLRLQASKTESLEAIFTKPCQLVGMQFILKNSMNVVIKRVFLTNTMKVEKVVHNNLDKSQIQLSETALKKKKELQAKTDRVMIAVMDSGVDYTHEELIPQLYSLELSPEDQKKYEEAKVYFINKEETQEKLSKRKKEQEYRTDYVLRLEKDYAAGMFEATEKLKIAEDQMATLSQLEESQKAALLKLNEKKNSIKPNFWQKILSQPMTEVTEINKQIQKIEEEQLQTARKFLKVKESLPILTQRIASIEEYRGKASKSERQKYDEALAQIELEEKVLKEKLADFTKGVTGWDFNDNDDKPFDYWSDNQSIAFKDFDHGTHVSGIIINNADELVIFPLRYSGGRNIIKAIRLAYEKGARVLNLSMGSANTAKTDEDIETENERIASTWVSFKEAAEEFPDMIFVTAAGNNGTDNDIRHHYPSNYDLPNIIAVAAVDGENKLTSFSNYGKERVHLAAPGEDINSLVVGGTKGEKSGTSMATPHVTRVVGIMRYINPELDATEIKEILEATVAKTDELEEKTKFGGYVVPEKAFEAACKTISQARAQTLSYCQ